MLIAGDEIERLEKEIERLREQVFEAHFAVDYVLKAIKEAAPENHDGTSIVRVDFDFADRAVLYYAKSKLEELNR